MIAIVLMDTFKTRFDLTNIVVAGMVVGFGEKAIRTWRTDFYANCGEFLMMKSAGIRHLFGYGRMLMHRVSLS